MFPALRRPGRHEKAQSTKSVLSPIVEVRPIQQLDLWEFAPQSSSISPWLCRWNLEGSWFPIKDETWLPITDRNQSPGAKLIPLRPARLHGLRPR